MTSRELTTNPSSVSSVRFDMRLSSQAHDPSAVRCRYSAVTSVNSAVRTASSNVRRTASRSSGCMYSKAFVPTSSSGS